MSFGFGFALPAYPLRGGGGNNPFNQLGATLDLSFIGTAGDLSGADTYTLNTDFITPEYQVAAQYAVWEDGVGLAQKTFAQIVTFTRASGATWFNSAGILQGVDFSVTSNTIGTGSKTFTLDATAGVNRYWTAGDTVLISDQANSANNMVGTVTSYNASTQVLVCNITSTGGSGTITSWRVGSTMPRFDYNPSTLAPQGLLIEEPRTNSIRNNTMVGAVAGTPGTLPQVSGSPSWFVFTALTGLTTEIVGTGADSGITYIDIRISGTPSAAGIYSIGFETNTGVAALNGQTWSESAYLKLQAGSFTGVSGIRLQNDERSASAYIRTNASSPFTVSSAALNTQRFSFASTLSGGATVAFIVPYILLNFTGIAIDITLRIGLPQLENNNSATGVASATVAAGGTGYAVGDVLQIVGGTGSPAARLTVATLSGSAVATVTVSTSGGYTTFPSPQPVSVTAITGTGSSATFNIVPQSQNGFATSVIPTTTTALTRTGDSATVATLAPWYNASEGTLYADVAIDYTVPATKFPPAASLNDNTSNNRIELGFVTSAVASFEIAVGGSIVTSRYPSVAALNRRIAGAYKASDSAISVNGGAATATSPVSASLPTVTQLKLGDRTSGAQLNGWVRRISYYPRRLSNADLQTLTT